MKLKLYIKRSLSFEITLLQDLKLLTEIVPKALRQSAEAPKLKFDFSWGEGLHRGVLCSVTLALQQSAASLFFSSAINIKYINLAAFNVLFNLYIYTGRLYRINLIMKLWQTNIMTDTLQPAPECHCHWPASNIQVLTPVCLYKLSAPDWLSKKMPASDWTQELHKCYCRENDRPLSEPGTNPDLAWPRLASASLRGSLVWGHINIWWDITHHQDISFLKSKSVSHCKIHAVFVVMRADWVCCSQSLVTIVTRGRIRTPSLHLDTATGLHPLMSTNQIPVSDTVDQSEARAGLLSHNHWSENDRRLSEPGTRWPEPGLASGDHASHLSILSSVIQPNSAIIQPVQ